jgi:hypothetical protein
MRGSHKHRVGGKAPLCVSNLAKMVRFQPDDDPAGNGGREPVTPWACIPWMSWGRGRLLPEPEQLLEARPRTQGWEYEDER